MPLANGIGIGLPYARSAAGGAVLIPAPFASVNGPTQGPSAGPYESWSAEYTGTPSVANPDGGSPTTFNVTRQGYDATAAAVSNIVDLFTVTSRVRQPYPSQASNSTHTVSLSDYIYSTDTVAGTVTNNSTFISPKPVCKWVLPHRDTVGNTLNVEIEAFHRNARNGKQVACVVFSATDGVTTVTQTVASPTVSGRTGDKFPVIVYAAAIDITTLADNGLVTVNAKAYPWIGAAASVADSSDGTWTALKDFSPRYYLKNTSIAAAPPVIYISTTGNNTTAIVSTNDAAARLLPALTYAGAINKVQAFGAVDGVRIRLQAGTFLFAEVAVGNLTQHVGALVVESDPNISASLAILNFGGSDDAKLKTGLTAPITTGCIRFYNLQMTRNAAFSIKGDATNRLEIIWDRLAGFDAASFTGTWLNNSDDSFYGATITNSVSGFLNAAGAGQHRIFRGVSCTAPGSVEKNCITGSSFTNADTLPPSNGQTDDGHIISFSKFDGITVNQVLESVATAVTKGFAVVQNVFVFTSTTSNPTAGISNDSATNSTAHAIFHNNSFAGSWIYGRGNLLYDEGATPRTNKLQSFKGNIHVAVYTKGDVFVTSGTRLGNWAFLYGVGSQGEFTQFMGNGLFGDPQSQAYPGLGGNYGTSQTVRNDPKFTTFQGTTWNGTSATAGTVGGVYTLLSGSPCKTMLASAVLPFDLAGTARATTLDSAGAYVGP